MTVIYDTYYPAIEAGEINLKDVNFSAYITTAAYQPQPQHRRANVTNRVETLVKVLVGGDISTLTMDQIINKVAAKLTAKEYELAHRFVVYNIATGDLCFCEDFNTPVTRE